MCGSIRASYPIEPASPRSRRTSKSIPACGLVRRDLRAPRPVAVGRCSVLRFPALRRTPLRQGARRLAHAGARHSGRDRPLRRDRGQNVDSLVAAADLADKLPELPDFDLATIADLDIDDFLQALGRAGRPPQNRGGAAGAPRSAARGLRETDRRRGPYALGRLGPFLEQTPTEAYKFADAEIEALEALAAVVEGVIPVLKILGLGAEIPATYLPAAASASYVLGMSPAGARRWIVELPNASGEEVIAAIRRRAELLEVEKAWAAKVPGYALNGRPEPSDLVAAAETLRKSGFGKLIASLGGKMKAARAVATNLEVALEPDRLQALGEHVAAMRAFEADESMAALFGPAWAGLETQMEDVKQGLHLRDLILRATQPHPGADQVIQRAMEMTPDGMADLAFTTRRASGVFAAAEGRARLEVRVPERFAAALRWRVAELETFLAVDPDRRLEESPHRSAG